MKILVTGIAGTGKTSLIRALGEQGYLVIDLDDSGLCDWIHKETGEIAEYAEGAGKEWIDAHRWQVIEPRLIEKLKEFPDDRDVYVGGKVATAQVQAMANIFDRIYLLQPNDATIDERLASRTTNAVNFGKKKEEREHIIQNRHKFEQAYRDAGAIPIENHGHIENTLHMLL